MDLTLTNRHLLVTVGSGPAVSAAATVVAAEVAVTLTRPVEKAHGPSLSVVASIMRILRAVWARIHRDREALSAAYARAARVIVESWGGRTALPGPEGLRCDALPGELRAHQQQSARQKQKDAPQHRTTRLIIKKKV